MKKQFLYAGAMGFLLASCVSTKKYKASQKSLDDLSAKYSQLQSDLKNCNSKKGEYESKQADYESKINSLNKQIDFLKQNNTQALKQLQSLSVISDAQAQSISKSLENIGAKDAYIQSLQSSIQRKDSLNMALVNNLKGAVGDLNDKDINIKVDKGVIYIDISDKLLFNSGRYDITRNAAVVLGKVAKVLKNQPDIEFMVEGHTDNVPFRNGLLLDNWDLSVKRATAVVRMLQNKYGISPTHMTAAGRGEYIPVESNETSAGRAANRRTRIIILPQLDQFFKLLETKK
jgi:chemotaxis protein MotB